MQPLGLIVIICLVMIFLYVFFKLSIFALRVTASLLFKFSHKLNTTYGCGYVTRIAYKDWLQKNTNKQIKRAL
jgi:hypothetical protein